MNVHSANNRQSSFGNRQLTNRTPKNSMLARETFPTTFSVLRDRKMAWLFLVTAAVLLFVFAAGLPGWPCPLFHFTGIPCPGCGLTRATLFLLQGKVQDSLHFHAFAPIVLLGLVIVLAAAVLPERARQRWLDMVVAVEQRTGVVMILLAALFLYWLARLIFVNAAYVQLIRG
jgi:hypothetical protein